MNDSSSYSTARDVCANSSLIMWSSRCRPVSFNDTSPSFSDVCLCSMILHLRLVMFVYVQLYFTCIQWCLSTFNYTSPAFSDVCLRSRSMILHLRSVMFVYVQWCFTSIQWCLSTFNYTSPTLYNINFSSTINNLLRRGVTSPAALTGRADVLPGSRWCCCILVASSAIRSLGVFIK